MNVFIYAFMYVCTWNSLPATIWETKTFLLSKTVETVLDQ